MKQPEVIIKNNKDIYEPKIGNILASIHNKDFILLVINIKDQRFDGVFIGKNNSTFGYLYTNRFNSDYEPFEGEITFKL